MWYTHTQKYYSALKILGYSGLPWWLNGKESNAGNRFDLWSKKIQCAVGQLSPCITATEAHTV